MIGLAELEAAAERVHAAMAPTPQYAWPLLWPKRRGKCAAVIPCGGNLDADTYARVLAGR